jgi:hypothetical protein
LVRATENGPFAGRDLGARVGLGFEESREVGPLLDTERANVAHTSCEPLQRLQGVHGGKEIGQILALANVDAALNIGESMAL